MASAQVPRVRKDITSLNANSPEIKAYKIAIQKMKALPNADKRSWVNQMRIHGTYELGFLDCQHGSWYFLPWHRAYLHAFENIVRETSGDPTFALPYWDWTKDPQFPDLFFDEAELNNPKRPKLPWSGRGIKKGDAFPKEDQEEFTGPTVLGPILADPNFGTFGGTAGSGAPLENGPHGHVHVWVGGDMAYGGSPYDPIFWLHHCNIDRIWAEWDAKHPAGTPTDAGWLNKEFTLFEPTKGNPFKIAVSTVLKTTDLGYIYDRDIKVVKGTPRLGTFRPTAFSDAEKTLKVNDLVATFPMVHTTDLRTRINKVATGAASARNHQLILHVQGVTPPTEKDVTLRVFVNCELLSKDTPIKDKSYVGSYVFFGHKAKMGEMPGHGDAKTHKVSFTMNATPAFQRMYGGRDFGPDEPLKVSIVAVSNTDRERRLIPIRPDRVRFEVVAPIAVSRD